MSLFGETISLCSHCKGDSAYSGNILQAKDGISVICDQYFNLCYLWWNFFCLQLSVEKSRDESVVVNDNPFGEVSGTFWRHIHLNSVIGVCGDAWEEVGYFLVSCYLLAVLAVPVVSPELKRGNCLLRLISIVWVLTTMNGSPVRVDDHSY